MAQALRKGSPLSKPKIFPLSPVLRSDSAFIYQRKYPDRFKLFGNEEKRPTRFSRKEIQFVFRHELRHDGESTVLVFFWWIVFAAPQGKGLVYIDQMLWGSLSSQGWTRRTRYELTILLKDDDPEGGFVHPEYRQLLPLVESMLNLIQSDYHWVKEEKYKHPEYLHDALQRVILNFVLENREASFMDLQKSPEYRPVKIINEPAPLSAATTEHRRCISILGRKRKATSSTAPGIQRLSLASSVHKSHLGRLQVCCVAWIVPTIELWLFSQAGRARMPAAAESSRDTGGHRKVYFIFTVHTSHYFCWYLSIASSRSVSWIVTPNVRVFRLTMVNGIHTNRTWCIADAIFRSSLRLSVSLATKLRCDVEER